MDQQNNVSPKKFGAFELIKESLNIFEKKFFEIFQIFLLFTLVIAGVIAVNHYYFEDVILAASDKNFHANLKLIPVSQFVALGLFNLFAFLIQFLLSLSVLKVIDQNIGAFEAINAVAKKFTSLIASLVVVGVIMLCAAVDFLAALVIGSAIQNLVAKILLWGVAIIFLVVFVKFSLRACFYTVVTVIEEKYFLQSLARSFFYSEGNVWAISWKIVVVVMVSWLLRLPLDLIVDAIASYIDVVRNNLMARKIVTAVAYFLPAQFVQIGIYLLYNFYKTNLPEGYSASDAQKKSVAAIVILAVLALGSCVIFADFLINNFSKISW